MEALLRMASTVIIHGRKRTVLLRHAMILPAALMLGLAGIAAGGEAHAASGLVASVRVEGPVSVGGPLRFQVQVRCEGPDVVTLGTTNHLFGWLVLTPDRDQAYFSDRLALTPATAWPATLAAGDCVSFRPVDAGSATAYRYGQGLKLLLGYPAFADGTPPTAAGQINAILTTGRARAKWIVCVPEPGDAPPILVRSGPIDLTVSAPRAAPVASSHAVPATADILEQFNRDAWSAQHAHDEAVKIGTAMLPALIAAASDRQRPGHARLWLATAIADLPDDRSVAALTALLEDADAEVRCVVGYYGPKQKSAALDHAIIAKAAALQHARFTSYALLGFLTFRGEAPEGLLSAGLESSDPQARTAAVRALGTMASERNKERLQTLLQDKDERVRTAARKVLDAMQPAAKDGSARK